MLKQLALLVTLLLCGPALFSQTIYRVSTAGNDNNDGSSWAQAFRTVQKALQTAAPNSQIWVAAGTYKPDQGPGYTAGDRTASFIMGNGIALYGGFAGGEATLALRDAKANVTILSGDLSGNDVVTGSGSTLSIANNAENSYHVISNNNNALAGNAVLDGFTVSGGNANGLGIDGSGGGMFNYTASPTVTACTFTGNNAFDDGGGMYNYVDASPTVTGCTFSGNRATNGGGMYNYLSQPVLTNCSFWGNRANVGGGMHNYTGGSPTLVNCSFAGNAAITGGGIYSLYYSYTTLRNCILWGDAGSEIYNDFNGYSYIYNSIIQGGCPGFATCTNVQNTDPLFVDASSGNLRLRPCSPAIDAGNNGDNTTTTDLDGNPRKVRTVDMGAYEYQGATAAVVLYVAAAAPAGGDGATWARAFAKLQDALSVAATCSNVTQIWVAKGTYYPDEGSGKTANDRNASFTLKSGLAIYGGFAGGETALADRAWKTNLTILSGEIQQNGDNSDNSFHVVYSDGVSNTAVLDGFTITGGNANDEDFHGEGGGLLNVNASSPTVVHCSFVLNAAIGNGGGVMNRDVTGSHSNKAVFISCRFVQNSAGNGGAMNNAISFPTLTNCLFYNNSARGGGAVQNGSSSPTLTNCTFSGNTASGGGGALDNFGGSSPSLVNCILWGNSGGEVRNESNSGGSPTVSASIVQGGCPAGATCNGVQNVDPLFVDAASGDLHLQACSPAIDAGDDAANNTAKDVDSNSRKVDAITGAGIIDLGAYEYQQQVTLTTYYEDKDGDGYGNPSVSQQACKQPEHYVTDNTDFNDSDPAVHLPAFNCPTDVAVANDAGKCSAQVTYTAPAAPQGSYAKAVSDTFWFTGAAQTFVVPTGVSAVKIQAWGAQGGKAQASNATGGLGGYAEGKLAAMPGQSMYVYVGEQPAPQSIGSPTDVFPGGFNGGGNHGANGGGGGGASDVRVGGNDLNNRVMVAGGGGGNDAESDAGGVGGGVAGGKGANNSVFGDDGGGGGTQTGGGAAGESGQAGSQGQGGNINTADSRILFYAGGGGGYYGGGSAFGACGGGGSGYVGGVTDGSMQTGVNSGNGLVVISYVQPLDLKVVQTEGLPSGSAFPVGTTVNTFALVQNDTDTLSRCSFAVTVKDAEKPVITCLKDQNFCYEAVCRYAVPSLKATDNCGIKTITYKVTGKTTRNGSGNNASGSFNPGQSTITWTVTDKNGNVSTCTTKVFVNNPLYLYIPDAKAACKGVEYNTVYLGYAPAASLTLTTKASGGTGLYKYQWSNGATTPSIKVAPNKNSIYAVIVTDSKGCKTICLKGICVVDARCGSKNDKVVVCHKGKATCVANKDVQGHLDHGDKLGGCSRDYHVNASGTNATLEAAEEEATVSEGTVYPNPTTGVFTLQLNNPRAEAAQVLLVDSKGAAVESRSVALVQGVQTLSFNLGGKANGLYLLQLRTESGVKTFKVLLRQ